MFHSTKKSNQDRNKNQAKFLDPRRDIHARLKSLRFLFELLTEQEVQVFFWDYSTEVFFVFYEEFTNLELSAKSRGKSLKDELEDLLVLLEKILLYLPDKVHKRWQFNAIGLILRKLLHHGNVLAIREHGIRLFLLWLQILQQNVDELNLAIYASIIPGFPSCVSKIDVASTYRSQDVVEYLTSSVSGLTVNQELFNTSLESEREWCTPEGCNPICPPQQGEKVPLPEELTKKFLDRILDYMTRRMLDIQWVDKHKRESGFYHIFHHFKRFYLPHIFPRWNPEDRLYIETTEIITVPICEDVSVNPCDSSPRGTHPTSINLLCQRAVVIWLITFTVRLKKKARLISDKSFDTGYSAGIQSQDSTDLNPISEDSPTHSVAGEIPLAIPQSKHYDLLCDAADIVRSVLYSFQENVIVVHEIFRQCFLMPLSCIDTMNHALLVYREWFFRIQDRPLFMLEPKKSAISSLTVDNVAENSPLLRSPSYKEAVTSCEQVFFSNLPVQNIRAGFQPNLRLFIALTAQIFFVKQNKDVMSKHADICKKIMKMYRNIVLEMRLDPITWRQLLTVLLKIVDHILTTRPPTPRYSTLGGQLAGYLLQTLFVTWIRASLQVYLTPDLWDGLLRVCTTFSSWHELIKEWAGTMETLTRVMARTVYSIDIQDPPLAKLTARDKVKMKRKITEPPTSIHSEQSLTDEIRRYRAKSKVIQKQAEVHSERVIHAMNTLIRPTIPRSASEPGMKPESLQVQRQVRSMHSETAITKPDEEPKLSALLLIQGSEDQECDTPQQLHKRTLAELADNKNVAQNFESTDSDVNSVFDQSLNVHGMTLQEALVPPEVNIERSSDSDTEGTVGVITYEVLRDNNTNSESSSINLPLSQSLGSVNSYFSESSQNLLANYDSDMSGYEDQDDDEDDINKEDETDITIRPNNQDFLSEKLETESYITGSDTTSVSDEPVKPHEVLTSHSSISSEQDLMNFEAATKRCLDAQSIDSHLFTLIEDESYNELKSQGLLSQDEIAKEPEEESSGASDTNSTSHVRFSEELTLESERKSEKMSQERKMSCERTMFSVIEGGCVEGWTPISSVILWRRILGILGNVNAIKEPEVHASVFRNLIQIWENLEIIRRNQGVSIDNKSTPTPSPLTPPLFVCSTWCFKGMSLDMSTTYKAGRVLAFKLMCMMTMKSHGLKPPADHMVHFFRLLHQGLTGSDQDVINAIIGQCQLFYAAEFESSMCLLLDFIYAATTIISTQYMVYPRKEALSILGSMLCLPGVYPTMRIYQSGTRPNDSQTLLTGRDLREKILIPILKAAKNDPSCRARCIALNSLGLFIIESLVHLGGHQRIYECLALLISSLEFHSQTVSTVALDMLWTLTFYYNLIHKFDNDLPLKIVEAICQVTLHLQTARKTSTSDLPPEEGPKYMSKLLLCLLDWCMTIPKEMLLRSRTDREKNFTYLGLALKIFKKCSEDKEELLSLERRRSLNINQLFLGESRPIRLARVHNDLSMDDPQASIDDDETDFLGDIDPVDNDSLHLTAQYAISQILNYYEHFPFDTGAVRPSSVILENNDQTVQSEEQNPLLDNNNVQFLLLDDTTLLSVIELPQEDDFSISTKFDGLKTISRFILRDHCGKHCWDMTDMFTNTENRSLSFTESPVGRSSSLTRKHSRNLSVSSTRLTSSCSYALPTWNTVDANTDRVDQLLRYIGISSPECLLFTHQQLNIPAPVPNDIDVTIQSSVVTSVLKQHNEEENYVHEIAHDLRITASEILPPEFCDPSSPYHVSKMLLHQLGFFSWNKRESIELLERNERLLREIKNLDNRPCRETHKIAVFYVAAGQEDKHSILSNSKASVKFEEFLAGMAWEIDLSTHTGFMGGLERNLSTGKSAPYFATHSLEVVFHVSTRIQGKEEENLKTKLRHLGNDEVHIVWSEHNRDFRRGIINTEFGDVLIIVYPLPNNLYRIKIDRNPKIPPFGPLFDGAIIDGVLLPMLVRCTAINAGRAKRSTIPLYKRHYEERARCIQDIARSRVRHTSFEDFASQLFAPGQPKVMDDYDNMDGVHRTFSAPSRSSTMSDPASVLKLLDTDNFRGRAVSTALKTESRFYRASSNTSLNEDAFGVFSDSDQKDFTQRRKSITKKKAYAKKKAASIDIPTGISEKTTD